MSQWIGGYTRRSRDEEKNEKLLEHHISLLQRVAREDGIDLPAERILMEIGSGDTVQGRPVFRALLEEWERLPRQCGGVVYVTEMSRLTRNFSDDAPRIWRALLRAGIIVRTPSRRYDLSRTDDDFLLKIESVMADRELSEIKRRLRAGQHEARMKGRLPNGLAPFGYRYQMERKTLEPHPERFPILVRCCRLALTIPVWRLAEIEKVPENCLLRALRNPTICGYPAKHYGPKEPDNPNRKEYVPLPRDQWVWPEVQNFEYPHACTREEWEELQAALDARRDRRARRYVGEGWCRDVIQFACDPGPVRLGSYPVSRRGGVAVMCRTYERSRPPGATHLFVPRATVHGVVYPALRDRLTHPLVIAWLQDLEQEEKPGVLTPLGQERTTLRQAISECRGRYQEAVDREMDADDPNHRQALTARRLRLQDRLTALQKELQMLEGRSESDRLSRLLKNQMLVTAGQFDQVWERCDGQERRALVNACLQRIEVIVEPTRPPRPHRREVREIVWQPWVPDPSFIQE